MNHHSDLAGFTCWKPEDASRILDVDALEHSPSAFRAVHLPMSFIRHDSLLGDTTGAYREESGREYGEESFLSDLLSVKSQYQLVSVIGPSGAGKSHLIRWLHVQISERVSGPSRRVILVPKSGTNLRSVLKLILEGMEGPVFSQLRDRLLGADETITVEVGRGRLLERLAEAIEHSELEALATALPDQPSTQIAWIRDFAPAFLRDDVFRKEWLRDGNAIAQMYNMVLGSADEVDRAETRRGFDHDDLPLSTDPHSVGKASQASQTFYKQITSGNAALEQALLAVMNYYLEVAIRALLKVGTDDLGNLLREVRLALAIENRELVVLIEDVARLQGVDRQLLDALLERSESGSEHKLCSLRAVVGCTTGYFQQLPNTFRTRCTFVVDLDGQRGAGDSNAVVAMAVRYLNAARLGSSALSAWHQQDEPEVPNACESCGHRTECHATLGSTDGFGHYPFNAVALQQTYERTNAFGLNPRFLLSDVLRRTLLIYQDTIKRKGFPDGSYHNEFGGLGSRWTADALARLEGSTGRGAIAERYKTLYDLWSLDGVLHDSVLAVYGLPSLGDSTPVPTTQASPTTSKVEPKTTRSGAIGETGAKQVHRDAPVDNPEQNVVPLLDALDGWARGESLSQKIANELRDYVFQAVLQRIDWDVSRLVKGRLSGTSSNPFRKASINFVDQVAASRAAEVSIELPLPSGMSRTEVAQALRGLIRFSIHANWKSFDGGGDALRLYARFVEEVGEDVKRQLRRPNGVPFDPAVASAELLRLGSAFHGLPTVSKETQEDRLDSWYLDWPDDTGQGDWNKLAKLFAKKREELRDIVEAYALCTKGGSTQTKWFDTVRFASTLSGRDSLPTQPMPPDGASAIPGSLRVIGVLREALERDLKKSLETQKVEWNTLSQFVARVCDDSPFAETREAVTKTRNSFDKYGVSYLDTSRSDSLASLSRSLNSKEVDRLLGLARKVGDADDSDQALLIRLMGLANTLRPTADKLRDYLDLVEAFCETSSAYIDDQLNMLGGATEGDSLRGDIDSCLSTLHRVLSSVGEVSHE